MKFSARNSHCQWGEWFTKGWTWRNFTILVLSFESASYKDVSLEITIGLLGLIGVLEWYKPVDRVVIEPWARATSMKALITIAIMAPIIILVVFLRPILAEWWPSYDDSETSDEE